MSPYPFIADAARSAVLLGLALAAMPLLRRTPASTRRLVLALALAAAALVPVVSRAVPSWHVLPAAELAVVGEPFAEPVGEAVTAPSVQPARGEPALVSPAPVAAATRTFSGGSWTALVFAAWGLGALVVLARLAFGLGRAYVLARRGSPVESGVISATMREAGARARVSVSAEVAAPAVTGVLFPTVLVPRDALGWSDARWRAVLLHELAHVRQRDCLAQIVGQIACAMHWFNPLAWLAARRLRVERELAADERVLASGTRPSDYAGHLLAIAAGASLDRAVPGGALGMAERSQLLTRVEAIVRPGAASSRTSKARAAAIVTMTAGLLGAVACVTAGGPEVATPPETASPPAPSPAASASAAVTIATATGPLVEEVASVLSLPAERVELTIDRGVQGIVDDEMKQLGSEWHPAAATAIVLDPKTGAVLAISDPAMAARPRTTGSTMKSLLVAAALEEGAVTPSDRFFCDKGTRSYGKLTLHDATAHEWLDVTQILALSSNIGASRIFDKLGGAPFGKWLRRFHFGEPSGIQLRAAPSDAIPTVIEDASFTGAALAGGHSGAVASPLHLAAGYAMLANQGIYNAPTLVRRALAANGKVSFQHTPANERVLRPETAHAVMAMLEQAVSGEQSTGKAARVEGVRVAGKTGTWDDTPDGGATRYYASFVGAVPAGDPRFVILVGAVVPAENATGGKVAAPVFARIAARALAR